MAKRIAPADLTWLLMDRPNNLMHVHGLTGFDTLPDFDELSAIIMERMVGKYRLLSQIPVQKKKHWYWEDDNDFSIDRHVRRVILEDGSDEAVQAHVSAVFSTPFDRSHPLWEMQLISGPEDDAPGYLLSRFHHGVGDGIRLVQMIIGTCDTTGDATPKSVGRNADGEHHHPLERVVHIAEHSVTDAIDYVQHAGQAVTAHAGDALSAAGRLLRATTNPLALRDQVASAVDLARHPVRLIDALTSVSSVDNEFSNSWREIGRLLLAEHADTGAWSGHPGVEKSVAWIEGFPLDGLRAAARDLGGTLNDILMAGVSLALTDYLTERGVEDLHDLAWMMPISLQPVDGSLPPTLGNHFVVVMLTMPLGIRDPRELVDELHLRTMRLKNSAEPAVAFGMQRVIADAPMTVARRLTDYFSGKTIGQLSNVPGPQSTLTMAGATVRSMLGWVPTSGDQPIGVCLFTYDGTVNVGVATDVRMIPDPMRIAELVESHLQGLAALATTSQPTD
jgi:diacylglycerol O-acyltransferase